MATSPCRRCSGFSRRRALASFGGAAAAGLGAVAPAVARAIATPARAEDERFMRLALAEAARGDFPFGAVIVKDSKTLAAGFNSGKRLNDPTAHGEIVTIRRFCADHPADELKGATIYTTGEPCPMCMGAIVWSGFGRVVYAASIAELSTVIGQIMITGSDIANAAPFAAIDITGGVLAKEALALFKP